MHKATDALSRLSTTGEDNTPLKGDLLLLAIDSMPDLGSKQICVIDTSKGDVLPLENDSMEVPRDTPPRENKTLIEQVQDTYYKTATLQIGWQGSKFFRDIHKLLTQIINADKTTQSFVPDPLRMQILHLSHHPQICGHPGQGSILNTLRQTYY